MADEIKQEQPTPIDPNNPPAPIADAAHQLDHATKSQTHNRNETRIFGRWVVPYPLYTVVFFALGVMTLLEVGIAEVFPEGLLKTVPLVGLSLAKAVMVVLFYMHLKEDSRIFAFTLILPLLIALVSALFLLSVPITGY